MNRNVRQSANYYVGEDRRLAGSRASRDYDCGASRCFTAPQPAFYDPERLDAACEVPRSRLPMRCSLNPLSLRLQIETFRYTWIEETVRESERSDAVVGRGEVIDLGLLPLGELLLNGCHHFNQGNGLLAWTAQPPVVITNHFGESRRERTGFCRLEGPRTGYNCDAAFGVLQARFE